MRAPFSLYVLAVSMSLMGVAAAVFTPYRPLDERIGVVVFSSILLFVLIWSHLADPPMEPEEDDE